MEKDQLTFNDLPTVPAPEPADQALSRKPLDNTNSPIKKRSSLAVAFLNHGDIIGINK